MNSRFLVSLVMFYLCITLFLTACGADPVEMEATVQQQVGIAVEETVRALPTETAVHTATAYPTYTPQATFTPFSTYTPQATYTPLATYTPFPSATPLPTETPTPTPTETPTVVFVTVAPAVSTAPPPQDTQAALLTQLDTALYNFSLMTGEFTPKGYANPYLRSVTINCQYFIGNRTLLIAPYTLDVSQSDPIVQNAYNSYQTAIPQIATVTQWLVDSCNESITNGQVVMSLANSQVNSILSNLSGSLSLLNQARDSLRP